MRCFLAALALLLSLSSAALATTHEPDPDDLEAQFQRGTAAVSEAIATPDADRRNALLDEAIAAFHAMLVANPGLVRVRLELAHVFFLKREDSLARQHFEEVLAGDVPPAVEANVRSFLAQIRARRRWSFNLGFSLAPDTNIGGTSDDRTIMIYGLPFERDAADLATSGIGGVVWGGAEYQLPLEPWLRLRAGAQISRREYEGSDFDRLYVGTHLGPRLLLGASTEASLLGSARQRWTGTSPSSRDLGARLEFGHRLNPLITAYVQAAWHERRYRTDPDLGGPVWDLSLRGAWVAAPTLRLDLTGGYGRERPKSKRDRSRSRWLGLGLTKELPLGFTLGGSAEMRWTNYESGWFPFVTDGGARIDRTRGLRVSAHNRAFTVLGFSPEISVVHETRDSNAQLHDYKRTSGELRFVQQF